MAYCIRCGGEVQPGNSYCHHCGAALANPPVGIDPIAQPTKKGGGFRKILKWGGIGCGGSLGLFVMLVFIVVLVVALADTTGDNAQKVPQATPPGASPGVTDRVDTTSGSPSSTSTIAPAPTPTPTPTATPVPTPVPVEISLSDIFYEYDQNKVRANATLRYLENGKIPLSTSGYVDEVEELYFIVIPTISEYSSQRLYCYYADTRAALRLAKEQAVSVTGRVSGMAGYSSRIHMFACEIEGMQFEMNPTVSAQALRANVVQVFCTPGSLFSSLIIGTGIIIDAEEGIVLTVHHVVADENDCETIEVQVQGIENRIPATQVKHCASIDRARLRIPTQTLSALSLQPIYRAAAPAQTDQEIYFWGYGPGELRMGAGIVKDVLGKDTVADAYAVPGDSGSPVFDENGHLLGTMSRSNRSDRSVFTGDEC